MMLEAAFSRADHYWAALLGCTPEVLCGDDFVVLHQRAPGEVMAVWRRGSWKLSVGSDIDNIFTDAVRDALDAFSSIWERDDSQAIAYAHQGIQSLLQRHFGSVFYGPAELLYCTPDTLRPTPLVEHCTLNLADSAAIAQFRAEMGGWLAWDAVHSEGWLRIIGAFEGERLVATAGLYAWEDTIAELYVDTVPDRRGRGYATALGGDAARWTLENTSLLAQSGGELPNIASAKMSSHIGYRFYGMLLMNDLSRNADQAFTGG